MAFARVEIKCEETLAFYMGYVKDVDAAHDQVLVAYEGNWQRDAWLSVSSLRPSLAPYNSATFLPSPGDVVEVRAKSAEHEPYSWWRGSVKGVRPNPAALSEAEDSLGSSTRALIYEISYAGWENEFTETLEKEMLRPFNTQACFTPGALEKHTLPLAPHLAQALTPALLQGIQASAQTITLAVEPAGTPSNVSPAQAAAGAMPQPSAQPVILVIGSAQACQSAIITLAKQLQQLNQSLQQQQQQAQQQQQHVQYDRPGYQPQHQQQYGQHDRYDPHGHSSLAQHHRPQQHLQQHGGGGGGYGHDHHDAYGQQQQQHYQRPHHGAASQYNYPPSSLQQHGGSFPPASSSSHSTLSPYAHTSTPPLQLEFHCPPHLMGMVIGKRHKNLYIAENLEGVFKVSVDTENGSIVVYARTAEAANAARSLLELTEQTLHIPSVIVGRVVGKNFSIVKEIEQHSGVLRIKVGDDRDHDMEYLQNLALNGIPGLSNLDENGNPLPNPTASALAAAAAGDKEKESHNKRSAFDRPYSSHHSRGGGRDGWGRGDRGGGRGRDRDDRSRWGHDDGENGSLEEFDIVALEEDKTVEISIIGSPATVSEAELLLRTHIGLITQIYKLSYDEAMLERQVHALNMVVPPKLALGLGSGGGNLSGGSSAFGNERGYGSQRRGGGDRGGSGGKDEKLPAWMQESGSKSHAAGGEDKLAASLAPSSGAASARRGRADPSMDIHAARLKGTSSTAAPAATNGHVASQQQQAKTNGAPAPAATAGQPLSYKNIAIAGASAEASAAANASASAPAATAATAAPAPAAAASGATQDDSSSEEGDAPGAPSTSRGGREPRKRGGRREQAKKQRRDQQRNEAAGDANAQKQQQPKQQGQQQQSQQAEKGKQQQQRGRGNRGGGGGKKDAAASAGSAPVAAAASAPAAAAASSSSGAAQ